MPHLHLTTFVAAPQERVFDLARSIDLHKFSMKDFGEKPVAGTISGLIGLNETVTWTARHLFKERRLKVAITAFSRPHFFVDEQVEGDFVKMKHEHYFKPLENGTFLIDQFYFETPYGLAGQGLNRFFLTGYMERLLTRRNDAIRQAAESNGWKHFLT